MTNINIEEVKHRMEQDECLNLVDVREPNEREEFNIGGIHLPLGKVMLMETDEIDHLKDKEVILYCRSGNRSGQAALMLEQFGFTNVRNLVGGMLLWNK